jgi:beta-hydroxylase
MFLDPSSLPGLALLRQEWRAIRRELAALDAADFAPWSERHIYRGDWNTFILFDGYQARQRRMIAETCACMPETARLLADVPGLLTGGFSRLGPGAHIVPHKGYDPQVVRVHLGMQVPDDCWIAVGAHKRSWCEGEWLAFDDTQLHMATNRSAQSRILLLLDIYLGCRPAEVLPVSGGAAGFRGHARHLCMATRFAARTAPIAVRNLLRRNSRRAQYPFDDR